MISSERFKHLLDKYAKFLK